MRHTPEMTTDPYPQVGFPDVSASILRYVYSKVGLTLTQMATTAKGRGTLLALFRLVPEAQVLRGSRRRSRRWFRFRSAGPGCSESRAELPARSGRGAEDVRWPFYPGAKLRTMNNTYKPEDKVRSCFAGCGNAFGHQPQGGFCPPSAQCWPHGGGTRSKRKEVKPRSCRS